MCLLFLPFFQGCASLRINHLGQGSGEGGDGAGNVAVNHNVCLNKHPWCDIVLTGRALRIKRGEHEEVEGPRWVVENVQRACQAVPMAGRTGESALVRTSTTDHDMIYLPSTENNETMCAIIFFAKLHCFMSESH